jgi:hypothetical protein
MMGCKVLRKFGLVSIICLWSLAGCAGIGVANMKDYFVGYDYDMGGSWFYIRSASKEEILVRYPFVLVLDHPENLLSKDTLEIVKEMHSYDLNNIPDKVHKVLLLAETQRTDRRMPKR